MGKIDMSSYQMSSSALKYSYTPDKQSLPLKYFLAIKVNLYKLSLAYPKLVRFSNGHFYDRRYLNLRLPAHSHTHSFSVSPLSCTLAPSFCFISIWRLCVFWIIHILIINICRQSIVSLGDLLTILVSFSIAHALNFY
jgi:hypothetical protein